MRFTTIIVHFPCQIIDCASQGLQQRYSGPGIECVTKLENVLTSCSVDDGGKEILMAYPEINVPELVVQLAMFRQKHCKTLAEAVQAFQSMTPEVRALFNQVEVLVRLLLTCPASSCTAERSFSALRRLKTWLRNTMSQKRLNSLAVTHTHQTILDNIDIHSIAKEFCNASATRVNKFGHFPSTA